MATRRVTLAHSPDGDDAFMFWALRAGKIPTGDFEVVHELADIQTLNQAALEGRYDLTAISVHAYARAHAHYRILRCGASVGDFYGPTIIAKRPLTPSDLEEITVASPGELTTAHLTLKLFQPLTRTRFVRFDKILDEVVAGGVDAGLLIHEGQLTYRQRRLNLVVDLGDWWCRQTGMPLPLGLLALRRTFDAPTAAQIAALVRASIRYALDHREPALAYAREYARGLDADGVDRFVRMYVNTYTLDLGDRGIDAIRLIYRLAREGGLLPAEPPIDVVG
jgi:1,4-dihydroxy-6-naphthoate synthase